MKKSLLKYLLLFFVSLSFGYNPLHSLIFQKGNNFSEGQIKCADQSSINTDLLDDDFSFDFCFIGTEKIFLGWMVYIDQHEEEEEEKDCIFTDIYSTSNYFTNFLNTSIDNYSFSHLKKYFSFNKYFSSTTSLHLIFQVFRL
ncbi:MAG: hypothetical protein R2788_15165 [Saprospiraceae bacterium]